MKLYQYEMCAYNYCLVLMRVGWLFIRSAFLVVHYCYGWYPSCFSRINAFIIRFMQVSN